MFVSFSVFFVLLKYLRKAFVLLWLLGPLSCKDFRSWDSRYTSKIEIKFEPEKDEHVPQVFKDLESVKLFELPFTRYPDTTDKESPFLLKDGLSIALDPNTNTVSFELENKMYYDKITISYECTLSLISDKAGGKQIQYTIKNVTFTRKDKDNKKPIFKKFEINCPVPLKEHKKDRTHHVTLYY